MELLERAADAIEPRQRVRLRKWCIHNAFTQDGKPYDHDAYPHHGAPGGPMDAFDCHQYLSIWLQWASRLGKSFFGQCAMEKTADCAPCPMMFASSDQKLAVEVTQRTYRMLEYCERLAGQLPPKHRQRQDLVTLRDCRIYVSWARSVSTLADKAVRVGHANEIDKWEHLSTSKEADPLKLFSDRFKEFPSHKKIYESTPAQKQTSRIERGRLASTNCSYWVPCPKCWRYQTLKMDQLAWDKNEAGKSDKDVARRTARYICEHCKEELWDEHRGPMMRNGVWCPEGCRPKDAEAKAAAAWWANDEKPWQGWSLSDWIEGTPMRDGRDAGYQLSSLYALSLSWGDIAAEWVDSQKNPQNLRNFINQWLAETWEVKKNQTTWEKLGQRLMVRPCSRGVVPAGFSVISVGVDKQATHYVFVVTCWDNEQRGHVIDYGVCEDDDELLLVLSRLYTVPNNGPVPVPDVPAHFTLIDSGYRPKGIHEFVKRCKSVNVKAMACRGSSNALGSLFRKSVLGQESAAPNAMLAFVDTITSQDWVEQMLHDRPPLDPGGLTIFLDSLESHEEFLTQLLNEAAIETEDRTRHTRENWHVLDTSIPNDFRDALRYSAVASKMISVSGKTRKPLNKMGGK